MNAINAFSDHYLSRYNSGEYLSQFKSVSSTSVERENADITIITDDGDKVTISTNKSMESSYSSYSSLLRSDGSLIKADGYEYQSQMHSNFAMSIVGDLDSKEYDDIMTALNAIDAVVKSAFSGNMDALQAMAETFGGLDSLSSLSASIQVEKFVSYEQTQSVVSGSNDPMRKEKEDFKDARKLDHALAKILNSGKKTGKSSGEIKHHMDDYLSGLLDMFSWKTGGNHQSRKAGELIKDMIMESLLGKAGNYKATHDNIPNGSLQ